MGYNMKRGNSGVKFRDLGSSPAKDVKPTSSKQEDAPPRMGLKKEGKLMATMTKTFRPAKKKPVGPKVDPDAPGTPGEPGYEPPVKRSDFDEGSKQQKMFDANQAKSKAKKKK